jgi:hypothetical protein
VIVFYEPISASIIGTSVLSNVAGRAVGDAMAPKEPDLRPIFKSPNPAEGDKAAEKKAEEDARRRARAVASMNSRRRSMLTSAPAPQGQRQTLLGSSGGI